MIDLKSRVKNYAFWVSVFIAIFTPILAYFGITAQDITSWGKLGSVLLDAIKNPYIVLLVLTSVYNAVVDTSTKGITDKKE